MTDKHNVIAQADAVQPRTLMHPLVEKMLTQNPTPEALEKILGLQREWEKDEARRAYNVALTALKGDLPPFLKRDKTVEYLKVKYTHTSLAAAMDTVTPHLTAHGFSLTWTPGNNDKGGIMVTAKLTHRMGHSEQATLTAAPDTGGNKSGPQAIASTVTLLQRYTALSLLGLATADQVEPTGEGAPVDADAVDTARNMRAMADLAKGGKTKEAVELFLGKPLKEWTATDLDKLRAWVTPASIDPVVSNEEAAGLKVIMAEFKLDASRFASIIESETGRRPKSIADVRKGEALKIVKAFDAVRVGAADLKGNVIERPPA